MFNFNNKDTRTTSMACSSVSIVNFEQVNTGWDSLVIYHSSHIFQFLAQLHLPSLNMIAGSLINTSRPWIAQERQLSDNHRG